MLHPQTLAGVAGAMGLGAVLLPVWSFRVRISPVSLTVAGLLSGVGGTATSLAALSSRPRSTC